jgi:hypothetical protein
MPVAAEPNGMKLRQFSDWRDWHGWRWAGGEQLCCQYGFGPESR